MQEFRKDPLFSTFFRFYLLPENRRQGGGFSDFYPIRGRAALSTNRRVHTFPDDNDDVLHPSHAR